MDLTALLDAGDAHVRTEFDKMPEVVDVTDFDPKTDVPPITARKWYRVTDAVAVVADLKGSTQLGLNKYAQSTASIYEAALRPVIDIFFEFGAGWIPVQGDCVIGIFWDDTAVERAMCAGITARTFSEKSLVKRIDSKWKDSGLETGFKVGVATSTLLVKRVGRPNSVHQDLVWPGKAVNHAVKAGQSCDAHELVVTGAAWDLIEKNDYLTFSCDCSTPSPGIWRDHDIEKLAHDDIDRTGRLLTSAWCDTCGETFCNAILDGKTKRDEVDGQRGILRNQLFQEALASKNREARDRRRSRAQLRKVSR